MLAAGRAKKKEKELGNKGRSKGETCLSAPIYRPWFPFGRRPNPMAPSPFSRFVLYNNVGIENRGRALRAMSPTAPFFSLPFVLLLALLLACL